MFPWQDPKNPNAFPMTSFIILYVFMQRTRSGWKELLLCFSRLSRRNWFYLPKMIAPCKSIQCWLYCKSQVGIFRHFIDPSQKMNRYPESEKLIVCSHFLYIALFLSTKYPKIFKCHMLKSRTTANKLAEYWFLERFVCRTCFSISINSNFPGTQISQTRAHRFSFPHQFLPSDRVKDFGRHSRVKCNILEGKAKNGLANIVSNASAVRCCYATYSCECMRWFLKVRDRNSRDMRAL